MSLSFCHFVFSFFVFCFFSRLFLFVCLSVCFDLCSARLDQERNKPTHTNRKTNKKKKKKEKTKNEKKNRKETSNVKYTKYCAVISDKTGPQKVWIVSPGLKSSTKLVRTVLKRFFNFAHRGASIKSLCPPLPPFTDPIFAHAGRREVRGVFGSSCFEALDCCPHFGIDCPPFRRREDTFRGSARYRDQEVILRTPEGAEPRRASSRRRKGGKSMPKCGQRPVLAKQRGPRCDGPVRRPA